MNKYLVTFTDPNAFDPQDRNTSQRSEINAENEETVRAIFASVNCWVISVTLIPDANQESIRDDMVAEVEPMLYILRAAVSGTFEVDAEIANDNKWMDTGVVRVPQTPKTSGTIRYDEPDGCENDAALVTELRNQGW